MKPSFEIFDGVSDETRQRRREVIDRYLKVSMKCVYAFLKNSGK